MERTEQGEQAGELRLTPEEIESRAADFSDWSVTPELMHRTFVFEDFVAVMAFVNRVAELAERQHHHPDIMIRYNKVTLTVTSHDAGGVTARDFTLAAAVESSS